MNKEDDMKIVGKTDVGGRTGWDEDKMQKKESDNEREWELIGGWMDRQDDERAAMTRKRALVYQEQKKQMMIRTQRNVNCDRLCIQEDG